MNQVKIGFDTCFLLNLRRYNIDIEYLIQNVFPNNNKFFFAHKTRQEFKGVLRNKEGKKGREAKDCWKKISDAFNLNLIRWDRIIEEEYILRVKEVNESLAKRKDVQGFQKTLKIEYADMEIIASFMKEKLDRIYTSDDGFYQTCLELELNAIKKTILDFNEMKKRKSFCKNE